MYTKIFIHIIYTHIYTVFIHIIYTQIFYTLFIHYLYKYIYTNRKFLYLNRSSSQNLKNSVSFLPQLIGRHNELPCFFTNRCPIFICVERKVIHCTFLHRCVCAQFPIRILVKRIHHRSIRIKERFSNIIEVQLHRFCELKKPFVIYLKFILKIEFTFSCENFLSFLVVKSRRTGIRLRVNTFGDSQSSYTSPNNLPPERKKFT